MSIAPAQAVFDVITDFLVSEPTAEAILAYRLPEALEKRALQLLERKREVGLSFDDELEMFDFIRADDIVESQNSPQIVMRVGRFRQASVYI